MISPTDYKIIADDIGKDYDYSDRMVTLFNNAVIDLTDVYTDATFSFSPETLKSELAYASESYDNNRVTNPVTSLNFVTKLQIHVTTHYGSVNSFLSDNGIKVNQSFADLSEMAGYTIDNGNIT